MAKKDAKLTKEQIKSLSAVGIKDVETVEEARQAMIERLKKNDIDECDDDPFDELLEMWEQVYPDSEEANDDLADEVEDEEEDEDDDSDDEDEDEDDEDSDDEEEDEDEDDEDDSDDEDEDEDEEEEEKPAKKSSKAKKAVEVEKKNDKVQKTVDKKAKKETTEKAKKTGESKSSKRLNPLQNEEDAKKFDGLKKALGKDFEYNFIANGGVSVKHLGKNTNKVFMSFDSPKVTKDGEIVGRVYLSSVRDEKVLRELFPGDFEIKKSWSGNLLVMDISLDEIIECITDNKEVFDKVVSNLTKKDEKLGKNREKMEADLKKSNKQKGEDVKSKTKKAKPEPEEDEDDEDEEEEEAPKPKKKAEAAPVKKKKKK